MLRWLCIALILLAFPGIAFAGNSFVSVCYHDVADKDPDQTYLAVSTAKLVQQFNWLRENGYHPISVDQLVAAQNGGPALPDKAVLLTFDDGYISFYTHVFPLLKAFHFPAVLALVGSWLEVPADQPVHYGQQLAPRDLFVTWDQVREMHKSGLVEIASHTFNLHHGILANPQGSLEPAVITRLFDTAKNQYEDDQTYRDRLHQDLEANSSVIARETGRRPRVMVWPYGAYNGMAQDVARDIGMPITATLDEGMGDTDKLNTIPRRLVANDPNLPAFVEDLRGAALVPPMRVVHVDLDHVYDPDPMQQETNVDLLLERVKALGANTVFLQAFADPDGNGTADAVYFPNRHLPMRADLFNRVAWQLMRRLDVKVYAWMPVLGFELGDPNLVVAAYDSATGTTSPNPLLYSRLSPFSPEARRRIFDMYEDLARYTPFDGLLFHDDAFLSDFEDASPAALEHYRTDWGLPASVAEIRADPALTKVWTRKKTEALVALTQDITKRVSLWRSPVFTARNIYAQVALNAGSEEWFAQSMPVFLRDYDYTALMAMPFMERAARPDEWLRNLVKEVKRHPDGLRRTVFELQSIDWPRDGRGKTVRIPSEELRKQMRMLVLSGVKNFGFYPDDFAANHPAASIITPAFSLKESHEP